MFRDGDVCWLWCDGEVGAQNCCGVMRPSEPEVSRQQQAYALKFGLQALALLEGRLSAAVAGSPTSCGLDIVSVLG